MDSPRWAVESLGEAALRLAGMRSNPKLTSRDGRARRFHLAREKGGVWEVTQRLVFAQCHGNRWQKRLERGFARSKRRWFFRWRTTG